MPQRILAIDDSLTFRKFISKALSATPGRYEVSLAADGTEGLAKALSERPDLILLDYIMPDLSGEEVCSRLEAASNGNNTPVVLMSSSVEAILATQARYSFVIGSVAKPFTPELLCDTVEQVLGGLQESQPNTTSPQTAGEKAGFSGSLSAFSVVSALLAVQRERATGVLVFHGKGKELRLQCQGGMPVSMEVAGRTVDIWEGLKASGWIWTGEAENFVFHAGELGATRTSSLENMLEWAMESVRMVGEEAESSYAWGDSTGVPAFNRVGYERIQRIALTEEEIDLIKNVDARSSLESIAQRLNWPIGHGQQVLFRFLCLEVFDFWPSAILNANRR